MSRNGSAAHPTLVVAPRPRQKRKEKEIRMGCICPAGAAEAGHHATRAEWEAQGMKLPRGWAFQLFVSVCQGGRAPRGIGLRPSTAALLSPKAGSQFSP